MSSRSRSVSLDEARGQSAWVVVASPAGEDRVIQVRERIRPSRRLTRKELAGAFQGLAGPGPTLEELLRRPAGSRPAPGGPIGGYELVEVLREDARGVLAVARDEERGHAGVLRWLPPGRSAEPWHNGPISQGARLGRPGSAPIYTYGQTDAGEPFLVLDVPGVTTLSEVLGRVGPLPGRCSLPILVQVLAALAENVHGELTSDDVLLAAEGGQLRVWVLDFGLAGWSHLRAGTPLPTPGDDLRALGALIERMCAPEPGNASPIDPRELARKLGEGAYRTADELLAELERSGAVEVELERELRVSRWRIEEVLEGEGSRVKPGELIETLWSTQLTAVDLERTELETGCRKNPIHSELDAQPAGSGRCVLFLLRWSGEHGAFVASHAVSDRHARELGPVSDRRGRLLLGALLVLGVILALLHLASRR